MDYGLSNLNGLVVFGKYDIAALRFGYARKLEKQDGSLITVENSAKETISQNQKTPFCLLSILYR